MIASVLLEREESNVEREKKCLRAREMLQTKRDKVRERTEEPSDTEKNQRLKIVILRVERRCFE